MSLADQNFPFMFDDCYMVSVFSYDVYANDGIAAVKPTQETDDFTHGYICESDNGINAQVIKALSDTLPSTLTSVAKGL